MALAVALAFFGLTDLLLVPLLIYDWVTQRRIHPATAWGALAIVASQPLRLMLGGTGAWLGFAGWLTGGREGGLLQATPGRLGSAEPARGYVPTA